jgi:hypothetical protein
VLLAAEDDGLLGRSDGVERAAVLKIEGGTSSEEDDRSGVDCDGSADIGIGGEGVAGLRQGKWLAKLVVGESMAGWSSMRGCVGFLRYGKRKCKRKKGKKHGPAFRRKFER